AIGTPLWRGLREPQDRDPVLGVGGGRRREAGVGGEQPGTPTRDGGGDVEAGVAGAGDDGAARQVRRQRHRRDLLVEVLDHVQGAAAQQDAVAVADVVAAEVDLVGHPGGGVHGEQLAGVALHQDEDVAAAGGLDPVDVEPVVVGDVTGQRHGGRGAGAAVATEGDAVEDLVDRVGDPGGVVRDDDVVDERGG